MKSFIFKLRIIYYPFLFIAAGFILVYTFLNGLLTIETTAVPLKEDVTDFWLPLALIFIPLTIWLRPRIKLLNLKTKRDNNLPFLYLMIAALAIWIPSFLLQNFMRTAMGKLTSLQSISQIRDHALTKYYTAKDLYIDTSRASFKDMATISGKNNEYLNFAIYIACPMFDSIPAAPHTDKEPIKISPAETALSQRGSQQNSPATDSNDNNGLVSKTKPSDPLPQAWACLKYKKQVSSRLEPSEKKEKWQEFAIASLDDFSHKDFGRLLYLDRMGNTDDHDIYEKAIIANEYITTIPSPLLILEPRFTPFEARNGHRLGWVFGAFGIGAFVWLIMLAIPKLDSTVLEDREGSLTLKNSLGSDDLKVAAGMLLPSKGYMVTPILIDLNILVFILMMLTGIGFMNFQSADLLTWGASYRPLTSGAGQWWRLLTSTFVHAGVMHLVFNMAGLFCAGILLEPALGKMRLAIVYLLTGVAASLTSLWWHPATVSVGASGAIFGLYGLFLALLTTRYFPPDFKKSFTAGVLIFVGGNLLIGLTGNIDNAAHIGGLISGFIAGLILYPRLQREKEEQGTTLAAAEE